MKIHLTAVGGSIMHNLALALHKKGYHVTGSDDEIYEPAKSRLAKYGLLPPNGWDPNNIVESLDLVILGMHAKKDNPELIKALSMNIPVLSFPEFIYEQSIDKSRVVIAGSHGKTTVTSMIMHVMRKLDKDFDYAVGAEIEGFEDSVKLTDEAPVIIIEGDEYLTSAIDPRPKFMWYKPQIALINGIAWDHINVFPTFEIYLQQFRDFILSMEKGADLVYNPMDEEVDKMVRQYAGHLNRIPAYPPDSVILDEKVYVYYDGKPYPISVFGEHNLQNLAGAEKVCEQCGIPPLEFWKAIADFKGAGKRLEKIHHSDTLIVFKDFAHAPSKVKASLEAVRGLYPGKKIFALLELHTFSSLNKDFIVQYKNTLDKADTAIVYIDPHAQQMKNAQFIDKAFIHNAFANPDIFFLNDAQLLAEQVKNAISGSDVILLMSSGNLGGVDVLAMIRG